jgi:hypothetical protein
MEEQEKEKEKEKKFLEENNVKCERLVFLNKKTVLSFCFGKQEEWGYVVEYWYYTSTHKTKIFVKASMESNKLNMCPFEKLEPLAREIITVINKDPYITFV